MKASNVTIDALVAKTTAGSEIQFGFGNAEKMESGKVEPLACFKITDQNGVVVADFGLVREGFDLLMVLIAKALGQ